MKPEQRSRNLLAITQSKAKMFEYGLALADHIAIRRDPALLLRLAVGMLGDLAAAVAADPPLASATIDDLSTSLRFSARYFDAFAGTELVPGLSPHLVLLASASYYLCNLPGSAKVLASRVPAAGLDLGASGLERMIRWLLHDPLDTMPDLPGGRYKAISDDLAAAAIEFYRSGGEEDRLRHRARELRGLAHTEGTPRELLFADAACAIALRRIEYSARNLLPTYSGLPAESWTTAFGKKSFVRELWPAQRLLGEKHVFAGASAVVQMPTSAGKSRATELTVRSAFLAGRASLAIVVAPFRALCHEIRESFARAFRGESVEVNELSDAFQQDFEIEDLAATFNILVVTPEKLVYVLRHMPELAQRVGLLVFDEGHQFDSGPRGVTYELLLTSLKQLIPAETQKVLISAVISNGPEIGQWLNGDGGVVVTGTNLLPTERSIAFTSWTKALGELQFVEADDPDRGEFFVPRVIQPLPLAKLGRERKEQFFPSREDANSVALYLGLRLIRNGAVAIFCGLKATAAGLAEMAVDVFARNLQMTKPLDLSNQAEVGKVSALYEANLSSDASATLAARLGVFTHHGNTPHGVRLAVEHALKEGLGRFVLCTSTLAQGVNLPIRYLLVTSAWQGGEKIKVRDFHNLIGRAGRSGMHTEGSVLFANPKVYDRRNVRNSAWSDFKALLQVKNSEPCASSLLSVLDPLKSDGGRASVEIDPPLLIAQAYVADDGTGAWITDGAQELEKLPHYTRGSLARQLGERGEILAAIESFLLAHWPEAMTAENASPAEELAKQTLAYHLASPQKRAQLTELFKLLATNIATKVVDEERRQVFGRTLYGLGDAVSLQTWVAANLNALDASASAETMFEVVWPCIAGRIGLDKFRKWQPSDTLKSFGLAWLRGDSFGSIHGAMLAAGATIGSGEKPRKPTIEQVVEIGESGFGFDGAHAIAGVVEVYGFLRPDAETSTVDILEALHKRFKYGLPSETAVLLYELGFADRVIASALANTLGPLGAKADVKGALSTRSEELEPLMAQYPAYFVAVFERLVR